MLNWMALDNASRLDDELALLTAMYPGHISFDPKSRDLRYTSPNSSNATLVLRLPDHYPEDDDQPLIISASDRSNNDIRNSIRSEFHALASGERHGEVLDILINRFEEASGDIVPAGSLTRSDGNLTKTTLAENVGPGPRCDPTPRTVVIWLHHLLATSKRKLAVAPSPIVTAPITLSGITKPGYPGIMIFSGRSDLVDAHVHELKSLNWQAFQIRYSPTEDEDLNNEAPEEWQFTRCKGSIVEVETMAEVVGCIVTDKNKHTFLRAIGVK